LCISAKSPPQQTGRKAERKKEKDGKGPSKAKGNNWKAFSVQNVGKASRRLQHVRAIFLLHTFHICLFFAPEHTTEIQWAVGYVGGVTANLTRWQL
jgi:hypothetical protein